MSDLWGLFSPSAGDLVPSSWGIFCLAVFIVGFSKTGLPGVTIVAVPLAAMVVPAKVSVGLMLPLYMAADLISVLHYWRFARRRCCFPYLVFVALGVWGASFVVGAVDDRTFGVVIGGTVATLVLLTVATDVVHRGKTAAPEPVETQNAQRGPSLVVSSFFGVTTGLFSALSNAAGPITSIYMIIARLEKFQLLGTTAVCAFFMNWLKVPLFLSLGIINARTLKLDLLAIPVIIPGCAAGVFFAKKLPQKAFKNVVLALAFLASLKLMLS
ncbi:MAG: sulfite exporter TauE/SafE family protein [Synergistaceae bacterium]|nr:sulfite exporter TauE/SafE family protein [Synergistaceae bacterium]